MLYPLLCYCKGTKKMRNSRPFPFVFTDYFANVFLLSLLFVSRLEFDDVTPPCGGVGALVFVLDGVGEDACFSLFPLAGVFSLAFS